MTEERTKGRGKGWHKKLLGRVDAGLREEQEGHERKREGRR